MDMRKLIDQTDFDNINQISKRWKKEVNQSSLGDSHISAGSECVIESNLNKDKGQIYKQNICHQSNNEIHSSLSYNTTEQSKKKRQVLPQIIDQDTEHFRNRLEHLLNGFKTDAVSEFMSMKRAMLDYQKETTKNQTHKYLTMYEEKHQQLLFVKEKLSSLTSDVQRKSMQIQLMSVHIAKLNERNKINKYLSRPFALLYQNKVTQKMIKLKMQEAKRYDNRRVQIKCMNGWRNNYRQAKTISQKQIINNRIQIQVNQIVGKFQKQMQMLRQKLSEATTKNQQYEKSIHLMQDNLKKAFLRGLSSMNMEAINIFGSNEDSQSKRQNQSQNNLTQNSLGNINQMSSTKKISNVNLKMQHSQDLIPYQNKSLITNKQKIQSKDHKWKQAPVMGVDQKRQIQEPRPHFVKQNTEAKVIRVIDGKSLVDNPGQKEIIKKNVGTMNSGSNKLENGKKK